MHPESYLFFDETDVISWEETQPSVLTGTGVVEIWRIRWPSFIDQIVRLFDMLPLEEKSKSTFFYHKKDKHRFIIGKAMLRILLGKYLNLNPTELNFTFGTYMKPVIKVGADIPIHFNVSHSGDYILIAVATEPIGVDVEYYETSLNVDELMETIFSEAEASFMNKQTMPRHAFFKLWTRKEALLKATSTGLNNNIRYVPCLNGKHKIPVAILNNNQHWRISNFKVDNQHVGSIAYLKNTRKLQFKQVLTQIPAEAC